MLKNQVEFVSCICGSDKADKLYEKLNICRCADCGLVYSNPRLTEDELIKGYNDNRLSHFNESLKTGAQDRKASLRIIKSVEKYKKTGKWLDVGCGTGALLSIVKQRRWEGIGIDLNSNAVAHCKQDLGLNVKQGRLQDLDIAENSVDIVSMAHSIEHEANPKDTLHLANKVLKKEGLIVIITPDIGSIFAKLSGRKWVHLKDAHLYYFTVETIKPMLEAAGFKVVECRPVSQVKSLSVAADRLKKYSVGLSGIISKSFQALSLGDVSLTIKLGDVIQVIGVKK